MNYKNMKKPGPMITKHFGMLPKNQSVSTWNGCTLELYPRTKFQDGKGYDDTRLLGKITFGAKDEFGCVPMTYETIEPLKEEEYREIWIAIDQATLAVERGNLIQVDPAGDKALEAALLSLKYRPDEAEDGCLILEERVFNWIAIYMCLFLAAGMLIGTYTTVNTSLAAIVGLVVGLLIGLLNHRKDKNKRAKLLEARVNALAEQKAEDTEAEDSEAEDTEEKATEQETTEEAVTEEATEEKATEEEAAEEQATEEE